ncbi:MAG: DMT family transporter [Terriglobales bacterium]
MFREWKTAAAIAVTLVLWASAFVGIRAGLKGYAPAELALLRYLVASAVLGGYALAAGVRLPARANWGRIALTGFLGFTLYNLALNTGATRVTAASASFVGNTVPVFSALAAVMFLREKLRVTAWTGIFISFLGATVIAVGEGGGLRLEPAILLVLAAALAQCAYFILQKPLLARMSALECTSAALWAGTLFLLPALPQLWARLPQAPLGATLAGVYLGVFPAAVGYVAWAYVLARRPVARTTSFLYLVPPIATFIGWLWLGELPSWLALAGGGLGVLGVVLVNRRRPR